MGCRIQLRLGNSTDRPFLEAMLYEAFFWDPAMPRPPLTDFRHNTEFKKLLAEWGRQGDRAIIAEEGSTPLGAAWFRLWTEAEHSYGFIDATTPELAIALAAAHRSKGLGRLLLRKLIELARDDGHPGLSLSVSPENRALHLYESEGFRKVAESGTSWTLLLSFEG